MRLIPLAFDSMGVRSMATFVSTKNVRITIDPSVALGPSRYGLPPHPLEQQRMNELWERIKEHALKSDVLVVTHYHYDHHAPSTPELYADKRVFLKHPTAHTNKSQKKRAGYFRGRLEGLPESLEFADARNFSFGGTQLKFSPAVFHGTNDRLGYVIQVAVRENEHCIVYTSDVEGPSLQAQIKFILDERPQILIVDGPLSYMLGYAYSRESLNNSINNLKRIIREGELTHLIIDHHLLRDLKWHERLQDVFTLGAKEHVEVTTAAGFLGRENEMLEARRKELWGK